MILTPKVSLGLNIDSNRIRLIRMDNNSFCKKELLNTFPMA